MTVQDSSSRWKMLGRAEGEVPLPEVSSGSVSGDRHGLEADHVGRGEAALLQKLLQEEGRGRESQVGEADQGDGHPELQDSKSPETDSPEVRNSGEVLCNLLQIMREN